MTDHPDRDTLKRFLAGKQPSDEARRTDQHLSSCPECRDRADEISMGQALRLLDSWFSPSYDEAFDRAAERVVERLAGFAEDPRSTEGLLTELLREPGAQRRRRIAEEERFHSLKLCQLLRSGSRNAWISAPATALEMADLAVEVSQYLDLGRYGTCVVEDARALAWSYLANAFRIGSDYLRAEQALHQAWSHHVLAGEDAYTETELLTFTASLRSDQARYQEAVQLSDRAIAIYRDGQDSHLEGASLILKGMILGEDGRTQEAISVLRAGLARLDPQKDSRLVFVGSHNLVVRALQGGAPAKAQKLTEQSRHLHEHLGRMDLTRVQWIAGRIANQLGHCAEGRSALHEACESFLDLQVGTEVFLVSVDLAEMYSASGERGQAKKILREMIPLGEALGLSREVLVARLLYEKASQR